MEIIGIICEYNPFHNGHIHHLKEIKKMYPDSIIVLILNGYFLQRGEISILSKEDKTLTSLQNGIDIVLELPFLYGTQSADTFALEAIKLLNKLNVKKIIFGSESNNIQKLKLIASESESIEYNEKIKKYLDQGVNYPTALAKALKNKVPFLANDLLGISYIKAINKVNPNIIPITIKRTNDYLDLTSNDDIISASNIRNKIKNNEKINKYLPENVINKLIKPDHELYFNLLKTIIITSDNLKDILDVDEGIENLLVKKVKESHSLDELITNVKSRRYTYNKINRMFIHILLGIKKTDAKITNDYIKILGFNQKGKNYLKNIKKEIDLTIPKNSQVYAIEMKAAAVYEILTHTNTLKFEKSKKPIIFD